jgi:hypothetical protein
MSLKIKRLLNSIFLPAILVFAFSPWTHGELPKVVLETLVQASEDVRQGTSTLTDGQRSLLVWYNDDINRARMGGWVGDDLYQAGQNIHHNISSSQANNAARSVGADFTVQQSTRRSFMPGTDSDYIYSLNRNSANPVADVQRIQQGYNNGLNDFMRRSIDADPKLRASLEAENIQFRPRSDWHQKLDVDFMADPRTVNQGQFEEIAKLNNDAYKRREAAEFERISRARDGTPVTPEMYTAYVDEMQDFIRKKRVKIEKIRENPSLLADPDALADYHRIMAQEQKYIGRIEATNAHLRTQEGLAPTTRPQASSTYVVGYDDKGRAVLTQRSEVTLSTRGAGRTPGTMGASLVGSTLDVHLENRALIELSESIAEAAQRNPAKWANAPDDIARLTNHLSPSDKGRLIESIKRRSGPEMAKQVAGSMRKQFTGGEGGIRTSMSTAATQLDKALRSALGVSDDLSRMGSLRRGFNEAASKALGGLENLSKVGTALEVVRAGASMSTFITSIQKAMDPNISDEEADKHFEAAMEASREMVSQGGLGALMQAVPTVGVIALGWTVGFDGTSYILTNTETGEEFNRRTADWFDHHNQLAEEAWADLGEYLGFDTHRSRADEDLANLEANLRDSIAAGRVILKPGISVKDLIEMIRSDDMIGARSAIEPVDPSNPNTVIEHLQDELNALQQLAALIQANNAQMEAELQSAHSQIATANGRLASLEDIRKKLAKANADCARTNDLRTGINEYASGVENAEEMIDTILGAIDSGASKVRTKEELHRLRAAHEMATGIAGRIAAAARHVQSLNNELSAIVKSAQSATSDYGRGLTLFDQGREATQAGISACLRTEVLAGRNAEHTEQLNLRKTRLLGQVRRLQQTFAAASEPFSRLQAIEQGVHGIASGASAESMLGQVRPIREGLEVIREGLAAVRGGMSDPQPCAEQATEDAVVKKADATGYLAALRTAQTQLVLDAVQLDEEKPVSLDELTRGIRKVPPSERPPEFDIAELTRGVRKIPPSTHPPGDDDGSERDGASTVPPFDTPSADTERIRPVSPSGVTASEQQAVYAVYAVHPYPTPPNNPQQFQSWMQRASDPRTFQPKSQPMGHIAFHVTGQVLEEYLQHEQRRQARETKDTFQLFRPNARYHQMMETVAEPGHRLRIPMLLSFVRLEREEPTWVRQTRIGIQPNVPVAGDIHPLDDLTTRGSWSLRLAGNHITFGPLNYDGDNNWTLETRSHAASYLKSFFTAFERMFQ